MIVYIHENGIEEVENPLDNTGEYSIGATLLQGAHGAFKSIHMFRDNVRIAVIFMHSTAKEPVLSVCGEIALKAETVARVLKIMENFEFAWEHFNEEGRK